MNRDFKGIWIPREIWLDKRIGLLEKSLWAEIHSLYDREKGGCYASNEYLAEFCGVQERHLQRMIANLKERGWLVQVSFDGRQRVLKAIIPIQDFSIEIKESTTEISESPQRCQKRHPRGDIYDTSGVSKKTPPSLLLDISRDIREEKTLFNLSSPEGSTDVAPVRARASSTRSFSKEVLEMADKMLKILMKHSPVYRPPQNMNAFYKAVQDLIEKDKQDPELMLRIFEWAVADNVLRGEFRGWQSVVVTNKRGKKNTNPIEIFTIFVTKIKADMDSRRERKFDPCSDEARMQAAMDYMNKGAL